MSEHLTDEYLSVQRTRNGRYEAYMLGIPAHLREAVERAATKRANMTGENYADCVWAEGRAALQGRN